MYIRKTVRRYKDKTYVNFLLVESVLTDKGPRQKVICSLGDLSPRPPEQWLALARKLQDALTGQLSLPGMADEDPELQLLRHVLPVQTAPPVDVDTTTSNTTSSPGDLVSVHIDRVTYETPRPAGHIHVGLEFWKRLNYSGPGRPGSLPTQVYPAREATLVRASQNQGWSRPSVEGKGSQAW
jgi:hypothetical protein